MLRPSPGPPRSARTPLCTEIPVALGGRPTSLPEGLPIPALLGQALLCNSNGAWVHCSMEAGLPEKGLASLGGVGPLAASSHDPHLDSAWTRSGWQAGLRPLCASLRSTPGRASQWLGYPIPGPRAGRWTEAEDSPGHQLSTGVTLCWAHGHMGKAWTEGRGHRLAPLQPPHQEGRGTLRLCRARTPETLFTTVITA